MNRKSRQRLIFLIAAWLGLATLALAQTFPAKVVKITAPYAAGAGPYDPRKDFVPVAMFYHTPFFLAVSTAGPCSALPLMQSGRLKLIAIAAKHRLKTLPDVPTLEEAGGPAGMVVDSWLAVLAPRGTPTETVRKINADINR